MDDPDRSPAQTDPVAVMQKELRFPLKNPIGIDIEILWESAGLFCQLLLYILLRPGQNPQFCILPREYSRRSADSRGESLSAIGYR